MDSELNAQAHRMPQICIAACLPLFYTPAWRSNTCNSAFQTENAGIENMKRGAGEFSNPKVGEKSV